MFIGVLQAEGENVPQLSVAEQEEIVEFIINQTDQALIRIL